MDEIKKFMWYMCSDWSLREANRLFGALGPHVWDMMFTSSGARRDSLLFFGSLDAGMQQTIVDRVHELYH